MSAKNKKYQKPQQGPKNAPARQQQQPKVQLAQESPYNLKIILPAAIAIITFIVYNYTLHNQFTNWDDGLYVDTNPYIKNLTPANLHMILFHNITNNYYHPLTLLSIAANYHFSKMDPFGYYLTNVIFHVMNTCLIFFLMLQLLKAMEERGYGPIRGKEWLAAFAALCHGVHPMHVESVSWLAERKDVMYEFFYFWGLMAYIRYVKSEKVKWFVYVLLFYLLSLASKPLAVVFPFSLFALDILLKKDKEKPEILKDIAVFFGSLVIALIAAFALVKTHMIDHGTIDLVVFIALFAAWLLAMDRFKKMNISRLALEKFPFFLVSLASGIWAWKTADASGSIASSQAFTIFERLMFAGFSYTMFVLKAFVPFHLCSYYPYPGLPIPFYFYIAPITALLIVAVPLYLAYKVNENYFRITLFGIGFFTFCVIFVLQFVSVGPDLMPERYTSIGYFGIFFMVTYGLKELWVKFTAYRFPLQIIPGIFICVLAYLCHERTKVWHSTETLWKNVIEEYPFRVETSYKNLGNYYAERNQYDSAYTNYKILADMQSKDAGVYSNLGNIYGIKKQFGKSLEYYTKSLKLDTGNFDTYLDRAITYSMMDSLNLAIKDYNHAYKIDSKSEKLLQNRGYTYLSARQYQNALDDYNHIIQINPDVPLYYFNRGVAESNLGNPQAALADFLKDLSADRNNGDCLFNLSVVYSQLKDYSNAIAYAMRAKQKGRAVTDEYISGLQQKMNNPGK